MQSREGRERQKEVEEAHVWIGPQRLRQGEKSGEKKTMTSIDLRAARGSAVTGATPAATWEISSAPEVAPGTLQYRTLRDSTRCYLCTTQVDR